MRFLFFCFLSFGVTSACGQGVSSFDTPLQVETVVVTGKANIRRSALNSTIIDSAAIAESVNMSYAELLAKHSPVFIKSYGLGSLATVSFRGTAASHTQVEWNGLNINSPMLGQVDFSTIPVWMVDRTELLHGGSSLQQGSGALGGSIILGSMPRWDKKIYGSVMQGVGSYGTYQTFASVGAGNKKVQARLRYIYAQARNDFEFLNTAVPPFEHQRQTNADYRKHTATADIYWNVGKGHTIAINGWFHTANVNLPTIMSYEGKGRQEWQQDQQIRAVAKWTYYGKNIKSELLSGYNTTTTLYQLANQTDLALVTNENSLSTANSFQNKYTLEWNITKKTMLRALLNANFHSVSTLNHLTEEGYRARRTELGAAVSVHQRFADKWSGYLLARYENNGAFMPSLGVEFQPLKSLALKINGTRNYHQPTLNDLYWLPGGNPNLRPEKGYSADLSTQYIIDKNQWGLDVQATGYVSWIDDWIIWQPSEFRYWTAANLRKVFARGVELNASAYYNVGHWKFSVKANYAYTRTTNEQPNYPQDESAGQQLIYIPLHKANIMAEISFRGFYFNYLYSFTGERFTNSANQSAAYTLPEYGLHNITLGKSYKGFDLKVKIDNLFDKNYQAILWRAMPGRNFTVLLRYTF